MSEQASEERVAEATGLFGADYRKPAHLYEALAIKVAQLDAANATIERLVEAWPEGCDDNQVSLIGEDGWCVGADSPPQFHPTKRAAVFALASIEEPTP